MRASAFATYSTGQQDAYADGFATIADTDNGALDGDTEWDRAATGSTKD